MIEDVASQALKLASGVLSLPMLLLLILALAILLVVLKRAGGLKLPPAAPAAPNPEDTPGSPPIVVRPDGSIPVSNPVTPPEVIP